MWGVYISAEAATTMPSYRLGLAWGAWPLARVSFGAVCRNGNDWSMDGPMLCAPELEAEYFLVFLRGGLDPHAEAFSWGLGLGF